MISRKMQLLPLLCLFIGFCLSSFSLKAQAPDSSKKYKVFIEPYIMFTSMSGTTGIGLLPEAFVCVPASEVFSHLKIGGMLYAEVHNNQFAFTSDLFYASLSQDASRKGNVLSGSVGLKQFMWELEGLYNLMPWLEAGVGARINSIQATATLTTTGLPGAGTSSSEKTNTWVDPLIVVRAKTWIHNKWLLSLRGDIGGFGVGSQFAWQLQPDIAYRASKLLQVGIGYRVISMDYNNKKEGRDRFVYDMEEYGPQVRIGFNF